MNSQAIGEVDGKIVDRWAWYQTALQHPEWIGTDKLPIHERDVQQGYFRVRRKDAPWEPVAIFYPENSDQIVAYRDGKEVRDIHSLWVWCCRQPIEYAAYEKAIAGNGWDDEPPAAPGIGDNSGEADPFDAIKIELSGEAEQIAEFMKKPADTQAAVDRLGIWSKRMTDVAKRADNQRVVEKEPHLTASREVDAKWRPIIDGAKEWAAKAKKATEAFLIKKKREEEARARAEAEKAAALRRQAEEAARAAREAEQVDEEAEAKRAELIRQAQEAEKASEVRNASAGRTGARVAIRTEKRAKIVDFDACLAALKNRPEIQELVQSLANRAVKSGFDLPGVDVETIEKVA